MKLTVIGASGRTGTQVLREGVRRGHEITAFTRRPETLSDPSKLAGVITGDGRDPHAVRPAVAGADAVIAIVAASRRGGPHHAAAVARVLIEVMTDLGVRRLTVTSAYPIVADKPRIPIALLRLVFAGAYADATQMERIVSASDLGWTIVRLSRLTDGPARGAVRTSVGQLERPSSMTRADAAAILLDVMEDGAAVKAAINACGAGKRR